MSIAEKLKERNPEMFNEVMKLKEKQYQEREKFLQKFVEKPTFEKLNQNVLIWAKEKDILKPDNHLKQLGKIMSEIGEFADEVIKENKQGQINELGDVFVTLIIIAEQLNLNPVECLKIAYDKIKDRQGKTLNGTFIKD